MRVIIAAAGTAGHINPGLAIANKIKEEEKDSKIIFIGTTRGLENDLVPRAGYELKTIDAYGLSKKISIENIKKMYKTLKGYGEAKKIIKEFKPDIVIGTGGYICGATISAAHSCRTFRASSTCAGPTDSSDTPRQWSRYRARCRRWSRSRSNARSWAGTS